MTAACLFFAGCESLFKPQTLFFLTFHQLTADAENLDGGLVISVRTADGSRHEEVRRFPLLSSAQIYKAEVLPGDDARHWGLRLFFDKISMGSWREASGYHHGDDVAVMVDGFLAGFTPLPARFTDDGIFEVKPLWNKLEAEAIVNNVSRNYKIANDK